MTAYFSLPRRHHTRPTVLLTLAILAGLATPGRAGWQSGGNAACVSPLVQAYPTICADGVGGAILTWHDNRSGQLDIYAQRVSGDGQMLWSANGVAVATFIGTQKFPVAAPDGTGGAILAWKDDRDGEFDIYAQRLSADGQLLWGNDGVVVCGAAGVQQDVEIVSDGQGGVIMAWRDLRGGGIPRLYAQRLDALGNALWTADGLSLCSASQQYNVSLAPDGSHGAWVTWFDYRNGSDFDIYAQHLQGNGTLAWTAGGIVVCQAGGHQMYPHVMPDGGGGIYLSWYDARSANYDIYAQRITGGGLVAAGWPVNGVAVCTASNDQFEPVMTPDGSGGMVMAWYDNRSVVSVYAQRLTGDGHVATGWPANGLQVNSSPSTRPAIFPGSGGSSIVVWHGTPGETNLDVVAQELTGDGQIAPGWPSDGVSLCSEPGDQWRPQGVSLGNGDVIVVWSDARVDAGDIYVARLGAGGANLSTDVLAAGFAYPVTPRNRNDAQAGSVGLTGELDGNDPTTCLNWGVRVEGASVPTGWMAQVRLDGEIVNDLRPVAGSPGVLSVLNQGPLDVRGGRHTLRLEIDPLGQLSEAVESDNTWTGQFVWRPMAVEAGAGQLRPAAPARGTMTEPNSDGFSFTPASDAAWGVAAAPSRNSGNVDLLVYDDYVDPLHGFSHAISGSAGTGPRTEFVIGSPGASPASVYPAVYQGPGDPGGESYRFNAAQSTGRRSGLDTAQWTAQSMGAHNVLDVYEGDFVGGATYYITLTEPFAISDLAFSIYPPGPGVWSRDQALASSFNRTADGEGVDVLAFVAPVTGRYPIAVYRRDGVTAEFPLSYHFFWSTTVSGVDDAPPPVASRLAGLYPNPMTDRIRLEFTQAVDGPAWLGIFDLNGRLIRGLLDGPTTSGAHSLEWDRRGDDGQAVASGIYFVRYTTGPNRSTQRIVVY